MNTPTVPASPPPAYSSESPVPGTIGFDLYLALLASHACLKYSPLPTDLGKLIDIQA